MHKATLAQLAFVVAFAAIGCATLAYASAEPVSLAQSMPTPPPAPTEPPTPTPTATPAMPTAPPMPGSP